MLEIDMQKTIFWSNNSKLFNCRKNVDFYKDFIFILLWWNQQTWEHLLESLNYLFLIQINQPNRCNNLYYNYYD